VKRGIWLNDKSKGEFGLFEQRVGCWHSVKRGSNIFGWTVRSWRRSDTGLLSSVCFDIEGDHRLTLGGRMTGGGG